MNRSIETNSNLSLIFVDDERPDSFVENKYSPTAWIPLMMPWKLMIIHLRIPVSLVILRFLVTAMDYLP